MHGATNDRALGAARRIRPALNVNVAELSEVVAAAPESMVVSGGVGSARATTLLGAYQ